MSPTRAVAVRLLELIRIRRLEDGVKTPLQDFDTRDDRRCNVGLRGTYTAADAGLPLKQEGERVGIEEDHCSFSAVGRPRRW